MKLNTLKEKLTSSKFYLILLGLASTIWFLIRVIPKPSRAAYPCMRVAAPFMSTLVIYLLSLGTTTFALKRFGKNIKRARFLTAGAFLVVALLSFSTYLLQEAQDVSANTVKSAEEMATMAANTPIGEAKGTIPGRVTWVHSAEATNENMNPDNDYWYEDKHVDQDVVYSMLQNGIVGLTGTTTINEGWDALFKYFNSQHNKGAVGYKPGEKIFIKVNFTNSCCSGTERRMDATPQLMLVLLKSLIEEAGVPQSSITIGDPFRGFKDFHLEKCYAKYPYVHYIGPNASGNVEQTTATSQDILKFSDGMETAKIAQAFVDADYFINMPCLKSHDAGGITVAAKNHQGSVLHPNDDPDGQSAFFMHYSLPGENDGLKEYRHLVDYMAHEHLGGKTLLILVDAIWGGDNWEGNIFKWQMDPFNNDYPSSLILAQDPVALESVCYDILLEEYTNPPFGGDYPQMSGANDYILQAASSDYWPASISYDPEGDGSVIGSLGVHEHWNNSTDRQYTRNLGTGDGIELQYITELKEVPVSVVGVFESNNALNVYPNPVSENATIIVPEGLSKNAELKIYNIEGRLVNQIAVNGEKEIVWNANSVNGNRVAAGIYMILITDSELNETFTAKVSVQ